MTVRRILVAIDASPGGRAAVEGTARLAARLRADLVGLFGPRGGLADRQPTAAGKRRRTASTAAPGLAGERPAAPDRRARGNPLVLQGRPGLGLGRDRRRRRRNRHRQPGNDRLVAATAARCRPAGERASRTTHRLHVADPSLARGQAADRGRLRRLPAGDTGTRDRGAAGGG